MSTTSNVTFAGPFHPLDDVRVSTFTNTNSSNARVWRLCQLPEEDKVLLLQMHHDPRCSVPISIYMFAVITLQRIFRGILVRRRLVFVLSHPESKAVLHQSYRRLSEIDWDSIRFRYWRLAESAVAERYQTWYPQIAQDSMKDPVVAGNRFQRLRQVVCSKWRASLLNMEFNRWSQYDRWQIYFVAAITIQRAFREHHQYLVQLSSTTSAAGKKKLMAQRRRRRVMLIGNTSSKNNDNNASGLAPNNFSKLNQSSSKGTDEEGNNNNNNVSSAVSATMTNNNKFQTRGELRYDHYHPYSEMSRENYAAAVIQELFRRFVYRRVFLLFLRLIKSREGAPTVHVLRAVSPSEAYLADGATGLHARFRLAAPINPKDKFPPALVFKIFTHNNVADIGSFAPRNYVSDRQLGWQPSVTSTNNTTSNNNKSSSSMSSPIVAHATTSSIASPTTTSSFAAPHSPSNQNQLLVTVADVRARNSQTKEGWYHRKENNEWRLVADVALLSRRECGPEVLDATTNAAVRHFFSEYLAIPQKQRCVQDLMIDEYIRRTSKRAEDALRAETKEKRERQKQKQMKQKQRKWMISLYAGSDTAVAKAASSVRQIVNGVQAMMKTTQTTGTSLSGKSSKNKKDNNNTELRDEDITRLTKYEARKAVDEAFDCLTEDEQQQETDRLLQWTEHLDAKRYAEDWLKLGTTGK